MESLLPHSRPENKSSIVQGELKIVSREVLGIQKTLSTLVGDKPRGSNSGEASVISIGGFVFNGDSDVLV